MEELFLFISERIFDFVDPIGLGGDKFLNDLLNTTSNPSRFVLSQSICPMIKIESPVILSMGCSLTTFFLISLKIALASRFCALAIALMSER